MFTLPKLAYDYNALEPAIDTATLEIHHGKHHGGYVEKLNAALADQPELLALPLDELMGRVGELTGELAAAVRNSGGGHFNHSFFWDIMAPAGQGGGDEPNGPLRDSLDQNFGSLLEFREQFSAAALSRFGSGWAWLARADDGSLFISSTPNQDNPLMVGVVDQTGIPILGLDVWEHSYYLRYQNRRIDYVAAWWSVVNWSAVAERLAKVR